jgi:hypothetical protein
VQLPKIVRMSLVYQMICVNFHAAVDFDLVFTVRRGQANSNIEAKNTNTFGAASI